MAFKPLRLVTALLLVLMLIASTAALGTVKCVCIPIPYAQPAAAAAICAVTKKPGCHCCGVPAKKQPTAKRCQFTVSTHHSVAGMTAATTTPTSAVLPNAWTSLLQESRAAGMPIARHLVLPRIRTPDTGPPGLRAPPIR